MDLTSEINKVQTVMQVLPCKYDESVIEDIQFLKLLNDNPHTIIHFTGSVTI
jgi:hypothetical protein